MTARALAIAIAVGIAPATALAATGVRYTGDLGLGWAFTDCPELGRAGLAILRCDEQRPDHALLAAGRSRLELPAGSFDLHLESRLRLAAPRTHGALSSLDAASELGARTEIAGALTLAGTLLAAQHFEPDPRWQSLRWAFVGDADVATSFGLLLDLHAQLARTDFPLDYPRNSYVHIDLDQLRAWGNAKVWPRSWLRFRAGYDVTHSWWRGPLGELLEDLVRLDGTARRELVHGFEAEAAVRPHPSVLLSAGIRRELAGGNVPLFRYHAYGPSFGVAWSSGPHTLGAAGRWLYYRFPEALVAPGLFANVREDNHFELHLRYAVTLGERWGAELSFSWVDNDSSDAAIHDDLCALPENGGCRDAAGRAAVFDAITSYSRYDQTTLEARVFVRW